MHQFFGNSRQEKWEEAEATDMKKTHKAHVIFYQMCKDLPHEH